MIVKKKPFRNLISIITPVYNMGEYISETIESVLNQTYKNFELILVDDGSTDNTKTEIQKYLPDTRIKYFRCNHKGPSAARNTGIKHSNGEFVAFLDGDDYWEPSKLEKQLHVFKKLNDVNVVYCKFHKVDCDGKLLPDSPQPLPPPINFLKALLFSNVVFGSSSSVMVRKNSLKDAGYFDEELYIGEDQDMWQRLAYSNKFHCINEYLVYIRIHTKSAQANREYFKKGQLLFIKKLKSKIPPEYLNHWPQIAFRNYVNFCQEYLHQGNYKKMFKIVKLIFRLGPKYSFLILLIIPKEFMKKTLAIFKKTIRKIIFSKKILRDLYLYEILKQKQSCWESKGKPLPAPPEVKQQIVLSYGKKYKGKIFIETGTFFGDMVEAVRYSFKQIYSIELGTKLYIKAAKRFAGVKNVLLLHGDSGEILQELVPNIHQPCLFWLDAHYSEGITARGDKETPIIEELNSISNHSFKSGDIILIDDARGFGKGDHPSLKWVKEWAELHDFNTFEVVFDIIRIYNKH